VSERLEAVAVERRVEAYCEAWLANRDPESVAFFEGLREAAPWALGYARETLAKVRPPVYARVAMWAAFAASGATVPEGIDGQFPLAYRLPDEPLSEPCSTRFLREHFMAIDESRRDVVLSAILAGRREHGTYEAALYLIEEIEGDRVGARARAVAADVGGRAGVRCARRGRADGAASEAVGRSGSMLGPTTRSRPRAGSRWTKTTKRRSARSSRTSRSLKTASWCSRRGCMATQERSSSRGRRTWWRCATAA
jgi:hypothetical protein